MMRIIVVFSLFWVLLVHSVFGAIYKSEYIEIEVSNVENEKIERLLEQVSEFYLFLSKKFNVRKKFCIRVNFSNTLEQFMEDTNLPVYISGISVMNEIYLHPVDILMERGDLYRVLFHEIVHVFFRKLKTNLPKWLEEGIAEYYAYEALNFLDIESELYYSGKEWLPRVVSLSTLEEIISNETDYNKKEYQKICMIFVQKIINKWGEESIISLIKASINREFTENIVSEIFKMDYEEFENYLNFSDGIDEKYVTINLFSNHRNIERIDIKIIGDNFELWGFNKYLCALAQGDRIEIEVIDNVFRIMFPKGYYETIYPVKLRSKTGTGEFEIEINGVRRCYPGDLVVQYKERNMQLINVVSIKDYLYGILAGEMIGSQEEAYKAQAVLARTYIVKNKWRHDNYNFCDLTHCQAYKGREGVNRVIITAVNSTENEILTYKNRPIEVFYHSTCPGKVVSPDKVWGQRYEYYVDVDCNYCQNSPHSFWETYFDTVVLLDFLSKSVDVVVKDIQPIYRTKDGFVYKVKLLPYNGAEKDMPAEYFRMLINKRFGWNKIKSNFYVLKKEKQHFVFRGRGLGHSVGLCQYGAIQMAKDGFLYDEILKYYFPRCELVSYVK